MLVVGNGELVIEYVGDTVIELVNTELYVIGLLLVVKVTVFVFEGDMVNIFVNIPLGLTVFVF